MSGKKIINKKILLGIMTACLVLCIIVVSSFFPFIVDPSRWQTTEFLTDEIIVVAITIFSMVSVMFVAQAGNMQNPQSEIARSKVAFEKSLKENVDSRSKFFAWVKQRLQVEDRKDIVKREMAKLKIKESVFYLEDSDIKALEGKPQKFGDIFYKSLDKKQIKAVLKLKKHIAHLKFVAPSYYTTYANFENDKNLSELASNESKKKVSVIIFNLFFKILLSLIISMIFASLVFDLTSDEILSVEAWLTFFSRIFSFCSASFLGYFTGVQLNDLDAFYINKRVECHILYKEDKDFVYVEVDEAKEEFKQYVLTEERRLLQQHD